MVKVPTPKQLMAVHQPDERYAATAAQTVKAVKLTNKAELQFAIGAIAEIREKREAVKAKLESITKPIEKAVKEMKAFFKPALASLEESEVLLKEKALAFVLWAKDERYRLLDRVVEETDKESRVAMMRLADDLDILKIPGFDIREKEVWEVRSEKAVKDWAIRNKRWDLLAVDHKAVQNLPAPLDEADRIPGVEYTTKRWAQVTPSKLKGA